MFPTAPLFIPGAQPQRRAFGGASFAPTDIANCSLWLAADRITGLVDGDPVSTWADGSGNGKNATQTGTARPTYKTNILNGLPVLRLDGSNDCMETASTVTVASIFFVAKYSGGATWATSFMGILTAAGGFTSDSADIWFIGSSSGGTAFYDPGSAFANIYKNGAGPSSLGTANIAPMNAFAYINGTRSSAVTKTVKIGQDRNNAGRFLNGDIAEIIMYSVAPSSGDRVILQNYLAAKYAL